MGPDEAGRAGRGLGRGLGAGWGGSRQAAAAQSGAGQHGTEVRQKREGEKVRWGGCDALSVRAAGGLKETAKWVLWFVAFRSMLDIC